MEHTKSFGIINLVLCGHMEYKPLKSSVINSFLFHFYKKKPIPSTNQIFKILQVKEIGTIFFLLLHCVSNFNTLQKLNFTFNFIVNNKVRVNAKSEAQEQRRNEWSPGVG